MELTSALRRLALSAGPRVFCVSGSHSRDQARRLRLAESIQLTISPRAANILLIVGDLDDGLIAPALVVHDALARPRATVWWRVGAEGGSVAANFPDAIAVDSDPARTLKSVHEKLLAGRRDGDSVLLPDIEPAQWRGVGSYGQGGKAMTGGVPYGRPLPERAEDRDGLKLDHLPVRVGPFFPAFPPGLALDVKLQGDVIQEVTVESFAHPATSGETIFHHALRQAEPVRDLELARARSHLYWVSDAVAMAGAASLSERILRLAERVGAGDDDVVRALETTLRRRGFFGWTGRGIGFLGAHDVGSITGPVARASGSAADARSEEAAYRRLGFEPLVQEQGDAAARWVQRLREAGQSLRLAGRAGDARAGGAGVVESPRGTLTESSAPSAELASLVPTLVRGMEWGDAVTAIVSLDLDMSEVGAITTPQSAAS